MRNKSLTQASCRHIGGHQNRLPAIPERVQHIVALLLRLVAMDRARLPAIAVHGARNVVHAPFRLHEDDRFRLVLRRDLRQQLHQFVLLLELLAHVDDLQDIVIRRQRQRANVDLDVVLEELLRQLFHLLRPRCRPHQHLPIGPNLLDDLANLRLEAHVQHAVRFVQHQIRAAPQIGCAALQEINQATGRRDHHLHAALQVAGLRCLRRTAEHARVAHMRARSKVAGHLLDLLGELARRRQYQHDGPVAALQPRLIVDVHNGGHRVRERLTGAGLRDADHVAAGQRDRPALRLNGGRPLEALLGDLAHRIVGKAALDELHHGRRNVASLQRHLVLVVVLLHLGGGSIGHRIARLIEVLAERRQLHIVPADAAQAFARLRVAIAITAAAKTAATAAEIAPAATIAAAAAAIAAAAAATATAAPGAVTATTSATAATVAAAATAATAKA